VGLGLTHNLGGTPAHNVAAIGIFRPLRCLMAPVAADQTQHGESFLWIFR